LSNNQDTGRQGEFLAAYILEKNGIEVHHVDRSGADLWCRINNAILTVQVKAATTRISPAEFNKASQAKTIQEMIGGKK
jgi:hypothetical protein